MLPVLPLRVRCAARAVRLLTPKRPSPWRSTGFSTRSGLRHKRCGRERCDRAIIRSLPAPGPPGTRQTAAALQGTLGLALGLAICVGAHSRCLRLSRAILPRPRPALLSAASARRPRSELTPSAPPQPSSPPPASRTPLVKTPLQLIGMSLCCVGSGLRLGQCVPQRGNMALVGADHLVFG